MEKATRMKRTPRPIEEIPAFRSHLARNGISFDEFMRRQHGTSGADGIGEALSLYRRKVNLNVNRRQGV